MERERREGARIDLGGTNIAAEEKKVVMAQLFNDAGIIGSAMLAI